MKRLLSRLQQARPQKALTVPVHGQLRTTDDLPRVARFANLHAAPGDAVWFPDLEDTSDIGPKRRPSVLSLRNALYFPPQSLSDDDDPPSADDAGTVPKGYARKTLGAIVAQDGSIYHDCFGKSRFVPQGIDITQDGDCAYRLPPVTESLSGTHLFAEMFYGHFGHTLTDMPARLWPVAANLIAGDALSGILGAPNMGAGPDPSHLPEPAKLLLKGLSVPLGKIRYCRTPVRIEHLLLPSRIAPYMGPWHSVLGDAMRRASTHIAPSGPTSRSTGKLWLSRSRVTSDARGGPGLAALDTLFERRGFTVVHPQELPFSEQVALVANATHVAGPIGSQLHLCAFMTTPNAKVLSVGPSYFQLDINTKFLSGVGGEETHFFIDLPAPARGKHKAPWQFDAAEIPRLEVLLDHWQQ